MLMEKTERSDSSNPQSAIRNPKFLFPALPGCVYVERWFKYFLTLVE